MIATTPAAIVTQVESAIAETPNKAMEPPAAASAIRIGSISFKRFSMMGVPAGRL